MDCHHVYELGMLKGPAERAQAHAASQMDTDRLALEAMPFLRVVPQNAGTVVSVARHLRSPNTRQLVSRIRRDMRHNKKWVRSLVNTNR